MARKFLVVVDDTPEFDSALRFAARRALSTGGRVVLLRAIPPSAFEHWSGVREEIMRQQREEAEALLNRIGEKAAELSGAAACAGPRPRFSATRRCARPYSRA